MADLSSPEKEHYQGHRKRLKEKYLKQGCSSFSDYELIELLLFFAIPRIDVKPLAKKLLKDFGGMSFLLKASTSQLRQVEGVGESASILINLFHSLNLRNQIREIEKKPILNHFQRVIDYCINSMGHETTEYLRILYLNKKNVLLADELQNRGTVDHTPFYPREIVKMALELGATALIVVHNHPSGDPTPSLQDIEMTKNLVKVCSLMNIVVHDHLVISKDKYVSMKSLNLF